MPLSSATDIETEFSRLPTEAQLSLLERLLRRVRREALLDPESWESELTSMARDPQIQKEIKQIETESRTAEADGLEKQG